MTDGKWLAIYLAVLLVPFGILEGFAFLGRRGVETPPTMSRVIAHLEQREGKPLRVGIVAVIAIVSTLLILHLGFQAI